MHKRRKTTVTGDESSAEITKKLNDMSNTHDDSDPDIVGVGEPKDPKRQGSQHTGKQTVSLKMS